MGSLISYDIVRRIVTVASYIAYLLVLRFIDKPTRYHVRSQSHCHTCAITII